MLTDPISDMLIRIKNGYLASKKQVIIPFSKFKKEIGSLLVKEGYLLDCQEDKENRVLKIDLLYDKNNPKITNIQLISKPGLRIYKGKNELPRALSGLGTVIVSTPKGLITAKQAKKMGVGGEVICKVW